MSDDFWFDHFAKASDELPTERAPASLKSRVYSSFVAEMAISGPLLDLTETKKAGGELCVFESILTWLPTGRPMQSMNPCRVCHARVLGERMDRAPIFWPGCPYSKFHHG